jgi:hypothetical protein
MRLLRQAILNQNLPQFVKKFVIDWFGGIQNVPAWVVEALQEAKIDLK